MDAHFLPLGTPNASKSPLIYPRRLLLPTSNAITSNFKNGTIFGADPTISENNKDDSPLKLGKGRMPPKMRKRWMHREIEAMKEAVVSNREVVMQLEKPPSMVGLRIWLEKSPGDRSVKSVFFPS
jgi:hypothetical protein